MAMPERDTVYTSNRTEHPVYTRESSATGWFVGIVVALALLAIAYLVFAAGNPPPTTNVDVNNAPAIETPAPMVGAPTTGTETAPMIDQSAPATSTPAPVEAPETTPSTMAPATDGAAPVTEAPAQ